ncbi:MAG: GAF domain-containing protein, partial [Candidatus Neomarinimicrobiota bacterium]
MKLYRQIISIILFILVLAVLVIPTLEGIPAYIIKAAIIGLLTAVLLKFSLTVANHDTSLDMESEHELSWLTLSDAKISDAVQNKYQQLLDFIIESIKSINPGYFTAIYMQDVKSGGYTVQKSSAQDFRDFLSHDNKLVNALIAGSGLSVNQRSDNITDWDKIFSTRTWRGSETLMSAPIYFKNRNRGFILVLADHFSNIQEKDKDILSSLTNFISFGMEDLEILENLRLDNYFQSRLTNL